MSTTVEIMTSINYEPLRWVPIFGTSGGDELNRAILYARMIEYGFGYGQFKTMPPIVRVVDGGGKVVPHE